MPSSRRQFLRRVTTAGALSAAPVLDGSHRPAPPAVRLGEVLYTNPLAQPDDVRGFRMEGDASVSFPEGRMRLQNNLDPALGQKSNFVYWCPETLPSDVAISWSFWPLREPGLAMLFFAAQGRQGEDLFDPSLAERSGEYRQYHSSDIDAFHASYFRRKHPSERAFHTCNLRKSHGFHLVAQGADPIPSVVDAQPPYRVRVVKHGPIVAFSVNDLELFRWTDDGETYGRRLGGGKIGFRQMAPLMAAYADLEVRALEAG